MYINMKMFRLRVKCSTELVSIYANADLKKTFLLSHVTRLSLECSL